MKLKPLTLAPLLICAGAIGLACLAQGLLGHLRILQLFQRLEWITYDWRLRTANQFAPRVSDQLGFVSIGDDTLSVFSQGLLGTNLWFGLKWPRHIYGQVVRELNAEGAKGVGMDILFDYRRPDHVKETPKGRFDPDVFFAGQLQQASNVIIAATAEVVPAPLFRTNALDLGDISQERDSDGVLRRARAFRDYRLWHPAIQREALLQGWDLARSVVQSNQIIFRKPKGEDNGETARFTSAPQGEVGARILALNPDGCFDPSDFNTNKPAGGFVRLYKPFENRRVWHLGIVLAARELNLDLEKVVIQLENKQIILTGPNGIQRIIPVDAQGQFLIDWSLRRTDDRLTKAAFETLVARDITRQLGSNITAQFAGKLVIIGSTATGSDLTDRGATPLEKDTPLTSNYWNVANSVLTGRFIRPSPLPASLLLVGLMGLGAAVLSWRLRVMWASMLVGLVIAAWVLLALFVFVRYRWWLPLVMPAGASVLTHMGLLTYQTFFEQNERRRVRRIFAKLVSPNVVTELLKAEDLSLVGARGQVTVFFADVRGFTEMTDRSHAQAEGYVRAHRLNPAEAKAYFDAQAQEVLNTVNLYLGLVADIIKRHDGTLDKYIGDCVMAFWGAPTPNPRHALACVGAAIEAQRAIHQLNQERAAQNKLREQENLRRAACGQHPLPALDVLALGTGINTGDVIFGLMGSEGGVQNYTVFGREVNLASRLEGYSGRGRVIIGEATYLELRREAPALAVTCIPIQLPPTALKGFGIAMKVFEVPWKPGSATEMRRVSGEAEVVSWSPGS